MKTPEITKQEMLEAISTGVENAMWQMITNATSAPCADFFYFVKEGVTDGIAKCCDINMNVDISKND